MKERKKKKNAVPLIIDVGWAEERNPITGGGGVVNQRSVHLLVEVLRTW